MNNERERTGANVSSADAGATAATVPGSENKVKVLACANCDGPVASTVDRCFACGSPLTGKEFPYIPRREASPDIAGMIKWWAILSVAVLALDGFSFGIGSSIAFCAVTLVYGVRIMRAYFL